jgi:hypothetical protein
MRQSIVIQREVSKIKDALIKKAKKSGLWENFGQGDVMYLKDKYDYHSMIYGSPEDRKDAKIIESFDNWCQNFDLSHLQTV